MTAKTVPFPHTPRPEAFRTTSPTANRSRPLADPAPRVRATPPMTVPLGPPARAVLSPIGRGRGRAGLAGQGAGRVPSAGAARRWRWRSRGAGDAALRVAGAFAASVAGSRAAPLARRLACRSTVEGWQPSARLCIFALLYIYLRHFCTFRFLGDFGHTPATHRRSRRRLNNVDVVRIPAAGM